LNMSPKWIRCDQLCPIRGFQSAPNDVQSKCIFIPLGSTAQAKG
jgi:hypothetical protein